LWADQPGENAQTQGWVVCQLQDYGVKFSCDPKWIQEQVDVSAMMYTISAEPFVSMTISRVDSKTLYLEQLDRNFFAEQNLYAENFQRTRVPFGGGEAIELKAFSRKEPNMRLLGYYYFYQSQLYGILFAVYPQERWEDYKFLLQKIIESFQVL
jgi:hypothetical protein